MEALTGEVDRWPSMDSLDQFLDNTYVGYYFEGWNEMDGYGSLMDGFGCGYGSLMDGSGAMGGV